jgi:hypothetical protein
MYITRLTCHLSVLALAAMVCSGFFATTRTLVPHRHTSSAMARRMSADIDIDSETAALHARSRECLDFQLLLDAVGRETVTSLGADLFEKMTASNAAEATATYAMVDQIADNLAFIPLLGAGSDLSTLLAVLRSIELKLSPAPEKEDLNRFSFDLEIGK